MKLSKLIGFIVVTGIISACGAIEEIPEPNYSSAEYKAVQSIRSYCVGNGGNVEVYTQKDGKVIARCVDMRIKYK